MQNKSLPGSDATGTLSDDRRCYVCCHICFVVKSKGEDHLCSDGETNLAGCVLKCVQYYFIINVFNKEISTGR